MNDGTNYLGSLSRQSIVLKVLDSLFDSAKESNPLEVRLRCRAARHEEKSKSAPRMAAS